MSPCLRALAPRLGECEMTSISTLRMRQACDRRRAEGGYSGQRRIASFRALIIPKLAGTSPKDARQEKPGLRWSGCQARRRPASTNTKGQAKTEPRGCKLGGDHGEHCHNPGRNRSLYIVRQIPQQRLRPHLSSRRRSEPLFCPLDFGRICSLIRRQRDELDRHVMADIHGDNRSPF